MAFHNKRLVGSLAVLMLFCAAALFAQTPSFITFDAPDAGHLTGQGTFAVSINDQGVIAGFYIDGANHRHGFIREADGTIREFDPPGMTEAQSTSINGRRQIVGYGTSNHGTTQGFQRRDTNVNPWLHINLPDSYQTFALDINDVGFVAGFYEDQSLSDHGFFLDPMRGFTSFDDPDAGFQEFGFGTHAFTINRIGTIAGNYDDKDVSGLVHGFVRDSAGNFTNFDAEGSGSFNLFPVTINFSGQIAGWYQNVGGQPRSFVRDSSSGNVTDFDVTGAVNTSAMGMNDAGTIVGQWTDSNSPVATHGFIRSTSGATTTFDVPRPNFGTLPTAINNSNQIVGYYFNKTGAHAFVR